MQAAWCLQYSYCSSLHCVAVGLNGFHCVNVFLTRGWRYNNAAEFKAFCADIRWPAVTFSVPLYT